VGVGLVAARDVAAVERVAALDDGAGTSVVIGEVLSAVPAVPLTTEPLQPASAHTTTVETRARAPRTG
jgi:hypothetical protein